MMTQIGIVAGAILELLEEKKTPLSIAEIKFYLDEPVSLIHMGIGWLVREKHVHVMTKENENYLFLVPGEPVPFQAYERVEYASST